MNAALFVPAAAEAKMISRQISELWAHISEDSLLKEVFSSLESFYAFFQKTAFLDMTCIDITEKDAVPAAEALRKRHMNTALMLIADLTIMPNIYLKPSIMASSLLLRPIDEPQVQRVLKELLLNLQRSQDHLQEDVFCLKTQEETIRIPHKNILYFEARNKKIYLRTGYEEYAFYSTIEKLSEVLPDTFAQCHRSFLINTRSIQKIAFPEGTVYLEDGVAVPLSRSFRSAAKEWLK